MMETDTMKTELAVPEDLFLQAPTRGQAYTDPIHQKIANNGPRKSVNWCMEDQNGAIQPPIVFGFWHFMSWPYGQSGIYHVSDPELDGRRAFAPSSSLCWSLDHLALWISD